MSLNYITLQDNITAWISSILTEQVILQQQNAPKPPLPYVSWKLLALKAAGRPHIAGSQETVSPFSVTLYGVEKITCSIQANGNGSLMILQKLAEAGELPSSVDFLMQRNLSLLSNTSINDITVKLENEWESRAHMDMVFATGSSVSEEAYVVEVVNADGTYKDPAGNVIRIESYVF